MSQPYRERGDCENNVDEFKNQWGWSGFTTHKLKSCRTMARLIAIVANWRNVFCLLADPTAHREAITSRPAYMGIMGRIVESGRKRIIHLTSTHAESELIRRALGTVPANSGTAGEDRFLTLSVAEGELKFRAAPCATLPTLKDCAPTGRIQVDMGGAACEKGATFAVARLSGLTPFRFNAVNFTDPELYGYFTVKDGLVAMTAGDKPGLSIIVR